MRKAVQLFAKEMEAELRRNDHKGGWGPAQCTIGYLRRRLHWELTEYDESKDPDVLLDIANFAMMLWTRQKHTDTFG